MPGSANGAPALLPGVLAEFAGSGGARLKPGARLEPLRKEQCGNRLSEHLWYTGSSTSIWIDPTGVWPSASEQSGPSPQENNRWGQSGHNCHRVVVTLDASAFSLSR
jgi:hypothetical protein